MTLFKRGEGFEKSLAAIAMLSIVALAAILVFLLTQALPILKEVPFFTFLFGTEWYPTGSNPDFEIGALLVGDHHFDFFADGLVNRRLSGLFCQSPGSQYC